MHTQRLAQLGYDTLRKIDTGVYVDAEASDLLRDLVDHLDIEKQQNMLYAQLPAAEKIASEEITSLMEDDSMAEAKRLNLRHSKGLVLL